MKKQVKLLQEEIENESHVQRILSVVHGSVFSVKNTNKNKIKNEGE